MLVASNGILLICVYGVKSSMPWYVLKYGWALKTSSEKYNQTYHLYDSIDIHHIWFNE